MVGKGKMKQIIDGQTGEIIEVETKNEIMVRQLHELSVDLEEYAELEAKLDYFKDQIETWKYVNREKIRDVLSKNGEKKVKAGDYTFSIVEEKMIPKLDIESLKEDGQYDNHLKMTLRKSYLRVTSNKEKRK